MFVRDTTIEKFHFLRWKKKKEERDVGHVSIFPKMFFLSFTIIFLYFLLSLLSPFALLSSTDIFFPSNHHYLSLS